MTTHEQTCSTIARRFGPVVGILAVAGLVMTLASPASAETATLVQTGGIAIDPAIEPYVSQNGLSGKLSIAGSDTMRPLVSKLAAQFMSLHPEVQIAVEGVGSNSAIREFLLGLSSQRRGDKVRGKGTAGSNKVELLASSRPLTDGEIKAFEFNYGHQPLAVPIALDAVAIYVHHDNPIQQLSLPEIDSIFSQDYKRGHAPITTWSQMGVKTSLATQPIRIFGRDKRSGTREFFKHVALNDGEVNSNVIEQPGSASEILAIAQDPTSIGYAGAGFQISAVRMVPITAQASQPAVLPSQQNVASGAYPLSRPLYLYAKKAPKDKLDPIVEHFLSFVNSRQGQETVARASFFPLTSFQVAKNRQDLGLMKGAMAETPMASGLQLAEQAPH